MRLRWVYLIVVIVLFDGLAAALRNKRKVASGRNKAAFSGIQPRIVGGVQQAISNLKYVVQVIRRDNVCGGCLVGSQWVMTAAHCVQGYSVSSVHVVGNTAVLEDPNGVRRAVSEIFVPSTYRKSSFNSDVALLKLNDTMTGDNVAIIAISRTPPRAGSFVRVSGWGSTSQGGSVITNLRSVQLQVLRHKKCVSAYRGSTRITRNMFCCYSRGKDTCFGDSGGALVQNGQVCGIVSFGIGCNRRGFPGVYTKVSTMYNWITNTIANN